MNLSNAVYFTCPHCGFENLETFEIGTGNWHFPEDAADMPLDYLEYFKNGLFNCYSCKKPITSTVELQVVIKNAKIEPKIDELI